MTARPATWRRTDTAVSTGIFPPLLINPCCVLHTWWTANAGCRRREAHSNRAVYYTGRRDGNAQIRHGSRDESQSAASYRKRAAIRQKAGPKHFDVGQRIAQVKRFCLPGAWSSASRKRGGLLRIVGRVRGPAVPRRALHAQVLALLTLPAALVGFSMWRKSASDARPY
jgi:hypothetical protein